MPNGANTKNTMLKHVYKAAENQRLKVKLESS